MDIRDKIRTYNSQISVMRYLVSNNVHYPPCFKPIDRLKKIYIRDLEPGNVHYGGLLLVRTIGQPFHPGAFLPVSNIIQDENNKTCRLLVFFPSNTPAISILASGSVLAIKAPFYQVEDGSAVIKVEHPSNIMILEPGHTLVSEAFNQASELVVNESTADWMRKGNEALRKQELTEAIRCYTHSLDCLSQEDVYLKKKLYCNRSAAAFLSGSYDLAKSDALLAVATGAGEMFKQLETKALCQAGNVAYCLRDFTLARDLFLRLLSTYPSTRRVVKKLQKIEARLSEQNTGSYDFSALSTQHTFVDCADFIHRTEIRTSEGCGRGLFAKVDIARGDLVLCEKAYMAAHPAQSHATSGNVYRSRATDSELWLNVVSKTFSNPSLTEKVLSLYTGEYFSNASEAPIIDGCPVVDVFQLLQIIRSNCFGYTTGRGHLAYGNTEYMSDHIKVSVGLWIQASYMNHSCIPNTNRGMTSDMIIVRATRDIPKGTEITASYSPVSVSEPKRHADLLNNWDFDCDCQLCTVEALCARNQETIFNRSNNLALPKNPTPQTRNDAIANALKVIRDAEKIYPKKPFENMPRVALQNPRHILMNLYQDKDKAAEQARLLLREHGYILTIDGSEVRLDSTNGLPKWQLVKALSFLSSVEKSHGREELAEGYAILAREMYLVVNGTMVGWE